MCFFKKKKKEEPKKVEEKKKVEPAKKEEPEKKAAPKKEAVKKDAADSTRVYHLSKREDGQWQVKFAGGDKVIKLFPNQKEAIEYTKKMAKNQDGAYLVHNSKGENKGKIKKK